MYKAMICALALPAGSASAAIYHDVDAFTADLAQPAGIETFEEWDAFEDTGHDFGPFTISETGQRSHFVVAADRQSAFGRVSGSNVGYYDDEGGSTLSFDAFDKAYTAFGFYISSNWTTVLEIAAGTRSVRLDFVGGSSPIFVGFTGELLELVTVTSAGRSTMAIDDVKYGFVAPVQIPVPASAGLAALGLLGLGFAGLRRRRD